MPKTGSTFAQFSALDLCLSEEACRRLSHHLGKHVVGLFVAYHFDNQPHFTILSGFLYTHNEIPFWVTAGHSLEKLKKIRDDPNIGVIRAAWLDSAACLDMNATGGSKISGNEIPIDRELSDLHMFSLYERGVDIGIIALQENTFQLMKASDDNLFFDERVLRKRPRGDGLELYFLFGFPKELQVTSETRVGTKLESSVSAPILVIPALPVSEEESRTEPEEFWKWRDAFFARLQPYKGALELPLDDIDMMSGSPIVSMTQSANGELRYYLHAIQSSWVKERRLIRGTPISALGVLLDRLIEECERIQASADSGLVADSK